MQRYIRNPLSTTSHLLGNNPSYQTNRRLNVSLANMDIKLLFLLLVPLLFVCVRLPGTIRYFISFIHPGCRLPVYNRGDDGVCINKSCYDLLYNPVLVNFQVQF